MRAATLLGSRRAVSAALRRAGSASPAPAAATAAPALRRLTAAAATPPAAAPAVAARRLAPPRRFSAAAAPRAAGAAVAAPPAPPRSEVLTSDPANNVSEYIYSKMGTNLHLQPDHPICVIKQAIYDYFEATAPGLFKPFDGLHPVVSARANFDEVLVPADHVSRSPNDTYYVNADTVLRCHTSAHQTELLRAGHSGFLVTGDVYRRDSIDATHYPVFHQMEGVRVFGPEDWAAAGMGATEFAEKELKGALEGMARALFGDGIECRWVDAYFPFTEPSYELEIFFNGKWLEVLGCGVMQQSILDANHPGGSGKKAWAFGLGLERLAMVLFGISDIRLFWSGDERFLRQFKRGDLKARFKPYSKFPPCLKDMAFWVSPNFTENNLCELVRGIGGDLVEEVTLIDEFTNSKTGRTSNCYRITYRSMERSLTDEEVNSLQDRVRKAVSEELGVELR
ncbi:hypothetical protein Rsub_11709 [Raphidocelis subcapitata]|uniref:phenylalanine--tRNA ligase n=1 Tax=Raphidocelis subcapitata TaxID=307507 RepID=A0A2V0PND0_9CHLO|nr:hypothetical protein Rsub_11709 [Raphidocelis subcapitata]|eukprot:GBF98917.1 hypothetical protein Rsub_11709 [Raphidocelis subcapitata]